MELPIITNDWTIFIDRDGVINKEKKGEYILNWNEFIFYDGAKEAMKIFNSLFNTIVIVTNQRGVGRGLMNEFDLSHIHLNMQNEIELEGGRIDKIYYCTDTENTSFNRKPNIGMALQAKKDFNNINFNKSFMIGNKLSDMQFGRNVGIGTVFLSTTNPEIMFPNDAIDFRFNNLIDFAKALKNS